MRDVNRAIKAAAERAFERAITCTAGTVGPMLLMMSGIGGVIFWPPPALRETYATISWLTTLHGVEGPIVRGIIGAACLWVWLFSDKRSARKAAQITSLIVILGLIVNFAVASQGLACFNWLAVSFYGLLDIARGEIARIEEGKAAILAERGLSLEGANHAT